MELITASAVQEAMTGVSGVSGARNYVFASADDEAHFMATASDIEVVRYAGAIAYAANGEVDKESAKKFAKNRGFLSGLMMKIWNTLKHPGSILKIGAIAGSIALVGTALTFAAKNPAQFGAISKKFADKASSWCAQVGQLAAKAIAAGKQSGGKIKGFVLNRLAGVIAKLKTLPALLQGAAAKGVQVAKQAGQAAGRKAGQLAQQGGNAAKQLGQQGAKKAGDVARQGAMRAGGLAHRAADVAQKHSANLAGGLRKAGTNVAMRGIPG